MMAIALASNAKRSLFSAPLCLCGELSLEKLLSSPLNSKNRQFENSKILLAIQLASEHVFQFLRSPRRRILSDLLFLFAHHVEESIERLADHVLIQVEPLAS